MIVYLVYEGIDHEYEIVASVVTEESNAVNEAKKICRRWAVNLGKASTRRGYARIEQWDAAKNICPLRKEHIYWHNDFLE